VRTFFGKRRGSSDEDSAIIDAKNFGFFEIYGVPHGQGRKELSQFGHFADKGGGDEFFEIMCERPLWTIPN